MSARLHSTRSAHAASESRVQNVSCPVLVSEGMVHFEYVPSDGFDGSAMQESGGSGVREFTTQPWIMRPRVLYGKTSAYMLQALSLDSPLHIWSPRLREIWESHLKNGTAVWVDVDNRDDARTNQAYVAMASGEADKFFTAAGCPHRYVKLSHRCDIHQASSLVHPRSISVQ